MINVLLDEEVFAAQSGIIGKSLIKQNWGGSRTIPMQYLAITPNIATWQDFAEVTLPQNVSNGFNVTIIPDANLTVLTTLFNERVYYRIDYGGGGIGSTTIQRSTSRPITLTIPGTYVRVQCFMSCGLAAPVGAIPTRDVKVFVTEKIRSLRYPLASDETTVALAVGGVGTTASIINRAVRSLFFSATDLATDTMTPINVFLYVNGVQYMWYYGIDSAIAIPLRIPDNITQVQFIAPVVPTQLTYWFEEEL